jgi:hypothetical protein
MGSALRDLRNSLKLCIAMWLALAQAVAAKFASD